MSNTEPYVYSFEIETLLAQFSALINGAVCVRYDYDNNENVRVFKETVTPWVVFGPKHRVIHSIVNQSKTHVYPFIACKITGIEGNSDRVAAKHLPIKRFNGENLLSYNRPTPITVSIEVTITTNLKSDLFQIYGKLATQFQPYCTFSWCVPHKNLDKSDYEELTGKVEWDFNTSIEEKDRLEESEREEYTCRMNFKVTGWLFPNKKGCTNGIIYDIGTSTIFSASDFEKVVGLEDFTNPLLSAARKDGMLSSYDNPREWNNGHPRIVNVYKTAKIGDKPIHFILDKNNLLPFQSLIDKSITFDGYNFERADVLFVPRDKMSIKTKNELAVYDYGSKSNLFPLRGSMEGKRSVIEGYKMNVTYRSRNIITANFKDIDYHGTFDVVVADAVDWDSAEDRLKVSFVTK